MTKVYQAKDPTQAHVLLEILVSKGIDGIIQDEQMFYLRGEIPVVYPSICVANENAEEARRLCAEFESEASKPKPGGSWICPTCGEKIDNTFSECWKCPSVDEPADEGVTSEGSTSNHGKWIIAAVVVALVIVFVLMNARRTRLTRPSSFGAIER